jgi:ABC-type oligopeptide transport system substrate-binding subunit/class 3 adenylate cyclase
MTDSQPREERRTVTALFADLVGSTPLGERLDPEEVRLIVGEAVARIVRRIEAYGGTVKDLAGDGVLALFGAPTAHEDDTERAVRTGLSVAEEIDEYGEDVARGWGVEPLRVRVGVATGPVVVGEIGAGSRVEYGATGDAVNVAARLQSAAEPGTVLVADATRRAVEPLFDWGESRALDLKGKDEPVTASAVHGAHEVGEKVRGLEGTQVRMVGRQRELDVVREAVDQVLAGAGAILFLTGEPGSGKSRLRAETHDLATGLPSERPVTWLEGRCVSYGETLPYWPFRDLLRRWLGGSADDPEIRVRISLQRSVEKVFGDRAREVAPYLAAVLGLTPDPEAEARLATLSPEALQYRTFEVVHHLIEKMASDGPVVVALEDLHWADATSLQLAQRLLPLAETAAVLFVVTLRPERDHPAWSVRESAVWTLPHRARDLALEALSGRADLELLHALVGESVLPDSLEERVVTGAEGNPFFLEELVRSLVDAGALVREEDGGWRFDHEVAVEVPASVEKVLLARIDRLTPSCHRVLTAASVLGRQFGQPVLEAVLAAEGESSEEIDSALAELQRLDLLRLERRWPQPEFRFKHVLIQETAYRTLVGADRRRIHRAAAEWLEEEASGESRSYGVLAHHWLAAEDEDKAVRYLTIAADRARQEYALDEAIAQYRELLPLMERRGERREMAVVLFKLALALHVSLRFAESNDTYQRAFGLWTPPEPREETPTETLRLASSFLPNDNDPKSAIAWPNIQLCMQLFDRLVEAWPERTIVPSLADRWEISSDGLRYVFHLRDDLQWSDGEPLTAHDVEFGIKRVLDPSAPGSSVAIYFVLENGQDYAMGRNDDVGAIGVRALDDRTVEFRLAAPAPYFLSVMNRPDGGPQPRHAIERDGGSWIDAERQVVSGSFRIAERGDDRLALERTGPSRRRPGNVARVEYVHEAVTHALDDYAGGGLDMVAVRYTPRLADLVPDEAPDAHLGPAAWSGYLAFNHLLEPTSNLDLRRALAHAVDREAVASAVPVNMVLATGGIVPPALQGHTPDIALRFDPVLAKDHLSRSGFTGQLGIAGLDDDRQLLDVVAESWRSTLGIDAEVRTWTVAEAAKVRRPTEIAPVYFTGWLPGYPDPEYYLRLLFQSDSRTNEGGFSSSAFDDLIERARQERLDRSRLELFHEADRMAVADRVAVIPLVYGRSLAILKPWVRGWWEFGKSSSNYADLEIDRSR